MLSDKALAAMQDIVAHGEFAIEYSRSAKMGKITGRAQAFFAVVRCLEIVSEASRRLPENVKEAYPMIPWRQIADAGNIYRHNYDGLTPERILETVELELPAIIFAMRKALSEIDRSQE